MTVRLFIVVMWTVIVVGFGIAAVRADLTHDDDHRPPAVTVVEDSPGGLVCRPTGVCRVEP